ncbi:caspase family protein [Nocardioides sp.]|uniref:caspase family protein n=1 Tax=Nocardioides sp. TaxID=35761 RepID=UPI002C07D0AF|nr:caspase family protein [Nocardioides sp.]HSX68692.1 caspase family protein [Nocardioides sp.]
MTKRAVVIGINDYSVQGFSNLAGCVRDADAMYHLLIDAFLFDPAQVFIYKNQQASYANIVKALNYILKASEPGDVACLYYAGHGGLHPTSTAGTYYQTIIPASGQFITDFELRQAADQLRPSEVNFTVILDSCHSGGMIDPATPVGDVRTIALAQQFVATAAATMKTVVPFGIAVPDIATMSNNIHQVAPAPPATVCYTEEANREFVPGAKATLLAASRWDEYAGESSDHGFLTKAILETVNASNYSATHQAFHSALTTKVHNLANHEQHPVLRGQQNRMNESFLHGWTTSVPTPVG